MHLKLCLQFRCDALMKGVPAYVWLYMYIGAKNMYSHAEKNIDLFFKFLLENCHYCD